MFAILSLREIAVFAPHSLLGKFHSEMHLRDLVYYVLHHGCNLRSKGR